MHPVPPLASHSILVFLAAIAVLLAVARLLGWLAERIGMPAIAGELATGVILGPSLLLHVLPGASHWLFPADANQMHLLDGVAQVGAVLLVGVTGTQLDLRMLRRKGGTAVTVSGLNLIVPLALGVTLGLFLPATVVASGHTSRVVLALFIGVTMCVSAIPVIAKRCRTCACCTVTWASSSWPRARSTMRPAGCCCRLSRPRRPPVSGPVTSWPRWPT